MVVDYVDVIVPRGPTIPFARTYPGDWYAGNLLRLRTKTLLGICLTFQPLQTPDDVSAAISWFCHKEIMSWLFG